MDILAHWAKLARICINSCGTDSAWKPVDGLINYYNHQHLHFKTLNVSCECLRNSCSAFKILAKWLSIVTKSVKIQQLLAFLIFAKKCYVVWQGMSQRLHSLFWIVVCTRMSTGSYRSQCQLGFSGTQQTQTKKDKDSWKVLCIANLTRCWSKV